MASSAANANQTWLLCTQSNFYKMTVVFDSENDMLRNYTVEDHSGILTNMSSFSDGVEQGKLDISRTSILYTIKRHASVGPARKYLYIDRVTMKFRYWDTDENADWSGECRFTNPLPLGELEKPKF